jgi:hypothetical protein
MKNFALLCLINIVTLSAHFADASEECKISLPGSVAILKDSKIDPDLRSIHGNCLMRHYLTRTDVATLLLKVIRDPSEDILLREDLIEAFGQVNQRKRIKIESNLGVKVSQQDKDAIDKTISNATPLIALTQAVKSMEEMVPATKLENDFLRTFSEIAHNEANHVQLRTVAVSALNNIVSSLIASGIYDDKMVKAYLDQVQAIAAKKDNATYFIGAQLAFRNLSGQLGTAYASQSPSGADKDPKRGLASPK